MTEASSAQRIAYLRSIRTALTGIFILCLIAAIYLARDFLIPVVLAFFIALTFRPLVRRLADYRDRRGLLPTHRYSRARRSL